MSDSDDNLIGASETYRALIEELIKAREEQELSQAALGRRIDRHRGTINNWESFRRYASFDDLESWARALRRDLTPQLQRGEDTPQARAARQVERLSAAQVELVARLLVIIKDMEEPDLRGLAAYIAALEASLRAKPRSASGTSA